MKKQKNNKKKYSKDEEELYQTVKKKRKRRLSSTGKVFLYTVALVFSILLVYVCFSISSLLKDKHTTKINYSEKGTSSFKVYLNNNTYYENSYLESGMHYIADLINAININYKYEIHATNKIDYKYKYDVVAKIVITEKNEADNILFTKNEVLVKNKDFNVDDTNFVIDESVDVNYNKYNDYVNNYKRDYSLDVDANVIISMNVKANGTLRDSKDKIDKNNTLDVVIPLSKKTIDITSKNKNISTSGTLTSVSETVTEARLFLSLSILFAILSLYLIFRIIYTIVVARKENSLYERTIKKYLKEYDRAIVETGSKELDESKFNQIIKNSYL